MKELRRWMMVLVAGGGCVLALFVAFTGFGIARSAQSGPPVRAAFYYPWFPEAWRQDPVGAFTVYTPTLGTYDSSSPDIIRRHIEAMQYGGIQAGITSWWGQGSPTDKRLPALLAATGSTGFKWTIYYENESVGDPPAKQINQDLLYLQARYFTDPAYLHVDGRPVVFVYADGNDECGMATRWADANAGISAFVVLKVFPGYRACDRQPDAWHQYAPALAADMQDAYSYTISPGFNKKGEAAPRLPRDIERWRKNIRDMVASGARFQLITSFNEWGEGTAVEPAAEWASPSGYGLYLDALHDNGAEPGGG